MSAPTATLPRGRYLRIGPIEPEKTVRLAPPNPGTGKEPAYFLVDDGDQARQVRLRGDPRIWEWAGVHEYLVRTLLRGNAPGAICHMLERAVRGAGEAMSGLRALDLLAGNGWMGSELKSSGAGYVVGADPSAAAAAATERDHPHAYGDYLVLDMRRLSESQRDELMNYDFNCLVSVSALAAEEPAPNAFAEAFNLLAPDGWVATHLHEDASEGAPDSRYARLIHKMIGSGALSVVAQQRYRHRFTSMGDPLFHVGLVGRKRRDFDPGEPG